MHGMWAGKEYSIFIRKEVYKKVVRGMCDDKLAEKLCSIFVRKEYIEKYYEVLVSMMNVGWKSMQYIWTI